MDDTGYKVKCSKKVMLFVSIGWGIIGGAISIGLLVLAILRLITPLYEGLEEIVGYIVILIFSIIFLLFVIGVIIFSIWKYNYVEDIYQKDRVIRMNGKKQKYVLYYNNIISIKEGAIGTLYFFCRDPVLINGNKKGPKTIIEHYKKEDIYRIKQIIGNSNYNIIMD